jgi:hypothetical protein
MLPVTMAAGSKACSALDRLNTGIFSSNPTMGVDVYSPFSLCLCRRLQEEPLR